MALLQQWAVIFLSYELDAFTSKRSKVATSWRYEQKVRLLANGRRAP